MTLQCALFQKAFSRTSASFSGNITDQKRLEIKAKQDARKKIRSVHLQSLLLDDCPLGCDRINNAQLPRIYVFNRQWLRSQSGQTITVKVTFDYYVIYACGNH